VVCIVGSMEYTGLRGLCEFPESWPNLSYQLAAASREHMMILRFNGDTNPRAVIFDYSNDDQLDCISSTANTTVRSTKEETSSSEEMGRNSLAAVRLKLWNDRKHRQWWAKSCHLLHTCTAATQLSDA
jgi:hypothetical protein